MSCKQLRMIVENKKAFSRVPEAGANASGSFGGKNDVYGDKRVAQGLKGGEEVRVQAEEGPEGAGQ